VSPERQRLAKGALAGATLLVLDITGPRVLDALAVSDRLFSGDAWGLVVAALTATLVCCRIAVYFVFPGYLLAALVFWLSRCRRADHTSSTSRNRPAAALG
jgi:uncharacterized membrane protein YbhN (UPF0104 family)